MITSHQFNAAMEEINKSYAALIKRVEALESPPKPAVKAQVKKTEEKA